MVNDRNENMLIVKEKIENISRKVETVKKVSKWKFWNQKKQYMVKKYPLDRLNSRSRMAEKQLSDHEDRAKKKFLN